MTRFLLLHGASANAGYWRFVAPLLRAQGHSVVAAELPTLDPAATFDDYATAAIEQADGRADVVVGQSLGAFTAGVVAARIPSVAVVLLCPMIPAPHERPAEWGMAVGQHEAAASYAASIGEDAAFDAVTTFFHDVPDDVRGALLSEGEPPQSPSIFDQPFPLSAWPDVPTAVVAGSLDRLFPVALQRRVASDRLGREVELLPTGHLAAFARPKLVAERLLRSTTR